MAISPGQSIGRYQLESLLGRGGMAQVFKAWDPNTKRFVAVKILHQHLVNEDNFKERFVREGTLSANLNHPNIVSLYDFNQYESDDGTLHYMVMPYIEGLTLKDRIQQYCTNNERMPLEMVVRIIECIAAALDYAHSKDMVHRDIKPGNILFDENDTPLLTDFGLARMTFGARLTQSGVASGTPAYMSPEQSLGEPGDHRSDIYSLGIILHELLTNELPFMADTSLAILMKHINEPLPSPRNYVPELSHAVESVVFRATAKDPDSRYQSAGELAAELRAAVYNEDVSSETKVVSEKAQKAGQPASRSSRRWLYAAGAVAIIAIALVGMVLLLQSSATNLSEPTVPPVRAMTAGAIPFSTGFDEGNEFNSGWPIREEGIFTTTIADSQYIMHSAAQGQGHTAIFSPDYYQYSSLIIETNATLVEGSQPESAYGLIFRYRDEDNYYVFTINGRQEYSIWLRQDGAWIELRQLEEQWTLNDAINPIGERNYLVVNASGNRIRAFVNGTRVVEVEDDTIRQGAVGFYIATTLRDVEIVNTEIRFGNFTVTNSVPSMSG